MMCNWRIERNVRVLGKSDSDHVNLRETQVQLTWKKTSRRAWCIWGVGRIWDVEIRAWLGRKLVGRKLVGRSVVGRKIERGVL